MNANFFFFLLLFLTNLLTAQTDAEQVEAVLNDYINGTSYNVSEKIARAFHPESNLYLTRNEDELRIVPSKEYATYFKEENRSRFNGRVGKVISIDLHRDIAYAKAEILMPARGFCYIDMFLVKKNEGVWSIIGKTASGVESTAQEVDEIYNQHIAVNEFEEKNGEQLHYEMPTQVERKLDSIFRLYDNAKTPGVAVGVVHRGKLVFNKNYGMANLAYGIPITENTVFPVGSASKQFTATALLLLADQGLLSLDDDIRKYLPELPNYGMKISLRQLANHTSGVRSDLITMAMAGYTPDDAITHEKSLSLIVRQQELNFSPGDQVSYSNGGYALLAEVVARVSGKPFATFLSQKIFQPLGMENTIVMDNYEQIIKRLAESYTSDGSDFHKEVMSYSLLGSTGVVTTVADLSKWMLNFNSLTIGSEKFFNEMNTPAVLNNGTVTGFALGQFIGTHQDLPMISHGGATAGFRSNLLRLPTMDLSVIFLSNNANIDTYEFSNQVTNVFLELMGHRISEPEIASSVKEIDLKPEQLEMCTGSYLHRSLGITRKIVVDGNKLNYIREDQNDRTTPLIPITANRFVMENAEHVEVMFQSEDTENNMVVLVNGIAEEHYQKFAPFAYSTSELEPLTGKFYSEDLQTTYRLVVESDTLKIHHPRMSPISLNPISNDLFMGQSWQFNILKFERDTNGEITGFRISSDRSRNILFEKG